MKPWMTHHKHLIIESFYDKERDKRTGDQSKYDGEPEAGPELIAKGDGEDTEGCC